jgi:cytidine deaminase
MKKEIKIEYELLDSIEDLDSNDAELLKAARAVTANAYAPYSNFFVGAVAELNNGERVSGTNQENASSPVGICSERVLLSAASVIYPNVPIKTLAISYVNNNDAAKNEQPVSPCGICRQSLLEYEERMKQKMRIILSAAKGKVIILESAGALLPLSFGSSDL